MKNNKTNMKAGKPTSVKNTKRKPKRYSSNTSRDDASLFNDASPSKDGAQTSRKFPQGKVNVSGDNDASWYAKNVQMLNDVASYSYLSPIGAPLRLEEWVDMPAYGNKGRITSYATSVPGLMTITTYPTPGLAVDATSPVNMAAQNIYTYVRYLNSGSKNYDAPDLMLYLLAMDSLYSCWNWMKRLYGLASSYNQINRYQPAAYITANCVDFEDLIGNLSDFRGFLNQVGAQINSFCVPATMNYNVRHSWMYSNVYRDSDTMKAQQYMFVPGIFYQYDETSSPKGGILRPIKVCNGINPVDPATPPYTVAQLRNIITGMLNALTYSEDIGVMSGDIKKAYGDSNLFTLSAIPDDYTVSSVYSPEVMSQIENLTTCGIEADDFNTMTIAQDPDTNWIKYSPKFQRSGGIAAPHLRGSIVNMHKENISPADTMVATRLTSILTTNVSGDAAEFVTVGSEFVNELRIYWFAPKAWQSPGPVWKYDNMVLASIQVFTLSQTSNKRPDLSQAGVLAQINMMSQFDWHPLVYLIDSDLEADGDYTYFDFTGIFGDLDMYTIVGAENLRNMNNVALLSLLDVPAYGPTF
nr:putative capsid [Marmot picobirnavirus]